jgi:hypothetical protein
MARPSPTSRRGGRAAPGHQRIVPSAAVRQILTGDYPQEVKQRVFLASRGAVHGRRPCLVCGGPGWATRIHIAPAALSVGHDLVPDDVTVYWLCQDCSLLPSDDEQIVQALSAKRGSTP